MKFDNFTNKAKDALTNAQNNVRYLEQQQVELEHLVLALLEPADGVAVAILEELGCNIESIRGQIEREDREGLEYRCNDRLYSTGVC